MNDSNPSFEIPTEDAEYGGRKSKTRWNFAGERKVSP